MGNVGEKVFIDLVSMSEKVRKNGYMFASAYPICNKEAGTVARVLIHPGWTKVANFRDYL